MPRIESQPAVSSQHTTPYPSLPEEPATDGRRYHTRRIPLKFSHTKAPFVEPPKPPRTRPPVPKSVARKGNRDMAQQPTSSVSETGEGAVGSTLANHTSRTQTEPPPNRSSEQRAPPVPDAEQLGSNTSAPANVTTGNIPSASSSQLNPISSLPAMPEDTEIESISTEGVNAALAGSGVQGNSASVSMLPSNPFATPRRPNRPASFTTPAVVIIQGTQDWSRPDHDNSQFPAFVPNTSAPFDTSVFSFNVSPHPNSRHIQIQQSGFSSWNPQQSEFAPPQSGSTPLNDAHDLAGLNQQLFQAPHITALSAPALPTPAADANALYTAIIGTLPPHFPTVPTASVSAHPFNSPSVLERPQNTPSTASAGVDSVQHGGQIVAISHANSLALDPVPGSNSTWQSAVAPSSIQLSTVRLPCPPITTPSQISQNSYRPNALRQGQFQYDEVVFSNYMKHRWVFYLATEDPFPINVYPARELCVAYAEQTLNFPRTQFPIMQIFDFVRRKDSNIRNRFLDGLLLAVEQSYDVNTKTPPEKIKELISNLNFAHTSYDPTAKRLTGRYRHPCIFKVVKLVLFPKRTRGKTLGVRFICEMLGGSPGQIDPSSIEAPIATIALACTLVLHAFHSIKAGDSSMRNPKSKKPVQLSERKYGDNYRKILAKMREYKDMSEVRKEYMAEIMKEYLASQVPGGNSDDDDVEFDDDMQSDEEL
ncbi:hypothetical protein RhiLY_06095 [Ceratobasidium sp. AG-Ba]|nr:hypothetical protein RhiLY_06095 [Ceratobasidium sp. AG-Ba]